MIKFVERAVRSLFFTVKDGGQLCTTCHHPFLSHIKLYVSEWVLKDVPCRDCVECTTFTQIDHDVHGG